jgi:excisionase family DNA binding protein
VLSVPLGLTLLAVWCVSDALNIYLFPPTTPDFIPLFQRKGGIFLDSHCILLYNLVRFYERLYFKKEIAFMEEKEIMTVKQVAEYLQMDEHTIYKLARSGLIPSLKIAGQWRFKKDVIDKWISEESLERVTQNIKSSLKKKGKGR